MSKFYNLNPEFATKDIKFFTQSKKTKEKLQKELREDSQYVQTINFNHMSCVDLNRNEWELPDLPSIRKPLDVKLNDVPKAAGYALSTNAMSMMKMCLNGHEKISFCMNRLYGLPNEQREIDDVLSMQFEGANRYLRSLTDKSWESSTTYLRMIINTYNSDRIRIYIVRAGSDGVFLIKRDQETLKVEQEKSSMSECKRGCGGFNTSNLSRIPLITFHEFLRTKNSCELEAIILTSGIIREALILSSLMNSTSKTPQEIVEELLISWARDSNIGNLSVGMVLINKLLHEEPGFYDLLICKGNGPYASLLSSTVCAYHNADRIFTCPVVLATGQRYRDYLEFEAGYKRKVMLPENSKLNPDVSLAMPPVLNEIDLETKELGQGGFGFVFKGKMAGKDVAIKKLSRPKSPRKIQGMIIEGAYLFECKHPNVITCHGLDKECNLVLEYMDCGDILGYIKNSNSSLDSSLAIALQAALGLQYIHGKGFVHTDLKSKNILINTNGEVKICDFNTIIKKDTVTGENVQQTGTLLYHPPEIYSQPESKVSFPYDIFCFGELLGELIVQRPFVLELGNFTCREVINLKELNHIHQFNSILEMTIPESGKEGILDTLLSLHCHCRHIRPEKRPLISEIVEQLSECVKKFNINIPNTLQTAFKQYQLKLLGMTPLESKNVAKVSHHSLISIGNSLLLDDRPLKASYSFKIAEEISDSRDIALGKQAVIIYYSHQNCHYKKYPRFSFCDHRDQVDLIIRPSAIQLAIIQTYLKIGRYNVKNLEIYLSVVIEMIMDLINIITKCRSNNSANVYAFMNQIETVIYSREKLTEALTKAIEEQNISKLNSWYRLMAD